MRAGTLGSDAVWYAAENGERSSCRAARLLDTDEWRKQYREAFEIGATCKSSEWQHEQEYRLLLRSFGDLTEKERRKWTYKFAASSSALERHPMTSCEL
jgi:hypothetical protein